MAQLQLFTKQVKSASQSAIGNTIQEFVEGVVIGDPSEGLPGTPRRSGYTRNCWDITVGSSNVEPKFSGDGHDRPHGAQIPDPELGGLAEGYALGDHAEMGNSMGGINELEFGSSAKAPSGFARIAIEKLPEMLQKNAAKVGLNEV